MENETEVPEEVLDEAIEAADEFAPDAVKGPSSPVKTAQSNYQDKVARRAVADGR